MQDAPRTPDPEEPSTQSADPDAPPVASRRITLKATPRRVDAAVPEQGPSSGAAAGPPGLPSPNQERTGRQPRLWTWPAISLVGVVVVVLLNWLANWLPFNDRTTGEISRLNPVPFQPAGWAFAIWSVIYALLFAFVIYSLLPVGRRSRRVQAIAPLFLIANIANVAWLFAWHWERFTLSLIAIVILLGSLAAIYGMLRTADVSHGRTAPLQRFLVRGTFSIYLGWITIATLANVEVWMKNGGWNGGPFGLRGWTVIFLLGGIIVAAAFAFLARDAAYPLVFAWGYLAIASEQWGSSSLVSILSGILALGAVVLTVMAALLAYDARRDPSSPPRPRLPRRNRTTMGAGLTDDSPLSSSR